MLPSKSCVFATASVIAFSVLFQSSLFAAEPTSQDSPSIRSYAASQERGNVRVTLLSVSRSISFRKASEKQANGQVIEALPALRIVYLVEKLDVGSPKSRDSGPTEIAGPKGEPALTVIPFHRDNTLVTERSMLDSDHDYDPNDSSAECLPPVADPKRAFVTVHWEQRAIIKTSHLRLTLHEGFDGRREGFRFENVPVP